MLFLCSRKEDPAKETHNWAEPELAFCQIVNCERKRKLRELENRNKRVWRDGCGILGS